MQAVVYHGFGDESVLNVEEVDKPKSPPSKRHIIIKIYYVGVTSADIRLRSAKFGNDCCCACLGRCFVGFPFCSRPAKRSQILGAIFSGEVIEIGKEVKSERFKVGDFVCGSTGSLGGYVEYLAVHSENSPVVLQPKSLSLQESCVLWFGGHTAYSFLKAAKPQEKERILINGASGEVGVAAVQLAAKYYKLNVTAICSGRNSELMKSLGANEVWDYTAKSVKEWCSSLLESESREANGGGSFKFDIVLDCIGSLEDARGSGFHGQVGTTSEVDAELEERKKSNITLKDIYTVMAPQGRFHQVGIHTLIKLRTI